MSDPSQRTEKIARLKRRIAAGSYETPEKVEAAVEAILEAHRRGTLRPGADRPTPPRPPK